MKELFYDVECIHDVAQHVSTSPIFEPSKIEFVTDTQQVLETAQPNLSKLPDRQARGKIQGNGDNR